MRKIVINTIGIAITVFAIATFFFAIYNYSFFENKANSLILSLGAVALLYMTFFLELIPNYVSPHLGIVSALLLNIDPIITAIVIIFASTVASLIGFEIGRLYGREFIINLLSEKTVKGIEKHINLRGGKAVVLLSAISPIPYIPMAIGSLKMERKIFVLWGIIPRQLSYVIATIAVYFFIP